uniref:Uncharacterized protein n=1 Tax=Arundo donax TaxID=35708 RepID=A0A0A8Z8D2_ARUDO
MSCNIHSGMLLLQLCDIKNYRSNTFM